MTDVCRSFAICLAWCVLSQPTFADEAKPAELQFNRDIRTILSENCFQCHGPDVHQRQAELRLDTREGATAEHDGGKAIVAGDVKASHLMQRILSTGADERMPPEKSGRTLTAQQIELLRRWIEQGG